MVSDISAGAAPLEDKSLKEDTDFLYLRESLMIGVFSMLCRVELAESLREVVLEVPIPGKLPTVVLGKTSSRA